MRARDFRDLGRFADERRRRTGGSDTRIWQQAMTHVQPLALRKVQERPAPEAVVVHHRANTGRLDLHGLPIAEAHRRALDIIDTVDTAGVVIVTGKSGVIRREFPLWVEAKHCVTVEQLAGGGAFRVRRRRR